MPDSTGKAPKDYAEPQGIPIAQQDWADVGSKAVEGIKPGWVLAFVVVVAILEVTSFIEHDRRNDKEQKQSDNTKEYFTLLETNRAQEIRRLQELVKDLAQVLGRQSDRMGRAAAQQATQKAEQ